MRWRIRVTQLPTTVVAFTTNPRKLMCRKTVQNDQCIASKWEWKFITTATFRTTIQVELNSLLWSICPCYIKHQRRSSVYRYAKTCEEMLTHHEDPLMIEPWAVKCLGMALFHESGSLSCTQTTISSSSAGCWHSLVAAQRQSLCEFLDKNCTFCFAPLRFKGAIEGWLAILFDQHIRTETSASRSHIQHCGLYNILIKTFCNKCISWHVRFYEIIASERSTTQQNRSHVPCLLEP